MASGHAIKRLGTNLFSKEPAQSTVSLDIMTTTIEVRIESLKTLQNMPKAKLEEMSKQRGNRQYALACGYMANAMHAHAAGDTATMWAYVERAKIAHKRAQEDERSQVRRQLGL